MERDSVAEMFANLEPSPVVATEVAGYVVSRALELDGQGWLYFNLPNDYVAAWETVEKMPRVLEVNGRRYGWSCWDSDRYVSIYRTGAYVAMADTGETVGAKRRRMAR